MEHRTARRFPRRLKVRFGPQAPSLAGFTQDVSETGAFITATHLPPIGTPIVLEFEPAAGALISATVVRHSVVPAELRSVRRHGFGVRTTTERSVMREVLELTRAEVRPATLPTEPLVVVPDENAWEHRLTHEVRHGGLSFHTRTRVRFDEIVPVRVSLAWRGVTETIPLRVVHVRAVDDGWVVMGLLQPGTSVEQLFVRPA